MTTKIHSERVERVQKYMLNNLSGRLTIDKLSKVACMSQYHWHRVYKTHVGETIKTTLTRIRMARAAYLLKSTNLKINQVADLVGYANPQSFSRSFTEAFAIAPKSYRETPFEDEHITHNFEKLWYVGLIEVNDSNGFRIPFSEPSSSVMKFVKWSKYVAKNYFKDPRKIQSFLIHHNFYRRRNGLSNHYVDIFLKCDSQVLDSIEIPGFDLLKLETGIYASLIVKGNDEVRSAAADWFHDIWLPTKPYEIKKMPVLELIDDISCQTEEANEFRTSRLFFPVAQKLE